MTNKKRTIRIGAIALALIALIAALVYLNSLMPIITGYAAKNLCSAVFISGREQADVEENDLNFSFIKFNNNKVDFEDKSVTSRFLWRKSKAVFREGFGVTLLRDIDEENLKTANFPGDNNIPAGQDTIPWPLGNVIPDSVTGINPDKLKEVSRKVMTDSVYGGNIYAFLVMHKGIPVKEVYKSRFDRNTRFVSWSMAKSFMNAVAGIMVEKGMLDIDRETGLEEWKNDERSKITIKDLMQMQSGLKWNEDYGNRSDVTVMLHCKSDMGKYAIEKELEYQPGTHWYYSSGTTNILSEIIHRQFGNDTEYYSFAENELFERLGMPDALFEVDPSGSWVGSSYLYATARDYARFALLYLNDGIFNGQRILPEGWVDFSTTEAPHSKGRYGAFFWLNRSKTFPSAPEDMFSCNGHDGQFIFMIPSKELAVVVLGYSPDGINLDKLLGDVIATLD